MYAHVKRCHELVDPDDLEICEASLINLTTSNESLEMSPREHIVNLGTPRVSDIRLAYGS